MWPSWPGSWEGANGCDPEPISNWGHRFTVLSEHAGPWYTGAVVSSTYDAHPKLPVHHHTLGWWVGNCWAFHVFVEIAKCIVEHHSLHVSEEDDATEEQEGCTWHRVTIRDIDMRRGRHCWDKVFLCFLDIVDAFIEQIAEGLFHLLHNLVDDASNDPRDYCTA